MTREQAIRQATSVVRRVQIGLQHPVTQAHKDYMLEILARSEQALRAYEVHT